VPLGENLHGNWPELSADRFGQTNNREQTPHAQINVQQAQLHMPNYRKDKKGEFA
jgi:hypothetical protein